MQSMMSRRAAKAIGGLLVGTALAVLPSSLFAAGVAFTNAVGHLVSGGNGLTRGTSTYDALGRSTTAQYVLDDVSYMYQTPYGFPCATDACTATKAAVNGPVAVSMMFPDGERV